ncbi:hypothetical protein KUTeg_013218, partial [Tegillarca granosa]
MSDVTLYIYKYLFRLVLLHRQLGIFTVSDRMGEPLRVVVTGAAGQIGYSLLYAIASGGIFGDKKRVTLLLLDIPPMMEVLNGVVMELSDCSFPNLAEVIATDKLDVAFKDVDVAMLVGAMPRKEGMERKDLLAANVKIFKAQGAALVQYAKKTVVVVGNPANTNAFICSHYAPSIPKENFSALTRLDQNRAQNQIAARLGIPNSDVQDCIIWGNHSNTQFPDVCHAKAKVDGKFVPVQDAVKDDNWIKNEFISTVQKRGAAVIKARKLSSAMSAAKATVDHVRDWLLGSGDRIVSMAVASDGSYGIPAGLIQRNGNWKIVQGLEINDFAREKMDITMKELLQERDDALKICEQDQQIACQK